MEWVYCIALSCTLHHPLPTMAHFYPIPSSHSFHGELKEEATAVISAVNDATQKYVGERASLITESVESAKNGTLSRAACSMKVWQCKGAYSEDVTKMVRELHDQIERACSLQLQPPKNKHFLG